MLRPEKNVENYKINIIIYFTSRELYKISQYKDFNEILKLNKGIQKSIGFGALSVYTQAIGQKKDGISSNTFIREHQRNDPGVRNA